MEWTLQWCVLTHCISLWGPRPNYVLHTFEGKRQWPLGRLWILICHILNGILIFRGADGKTLAGLYLWTGRPWCWWAWLHSFIFLTRCVTFLLVAVHVHNDFTYLIRRQQTVLFRTLILTAFHFAVDRNTFHLSNRKLTNVFGWYSANE